MTLPSVTCIMPTRDRREFVAQAVSYFRRQDYPDAELVVVDDGYDAVGDLVRDDLSLTYVRLASTHAIGAKRNIACRHARGEMIAHWDDDDWSAPDRLRRQVEAMLSAGADACGISELLYYRPRRADAWLYRGGREVAGCSIVYRRALWEEAAFPDTSQGEDGAFIGRLAPGRVLALADRSLMVAVVHGGNVTTLPLGAPQWESAGLDGISGLLGEDRGFYTALRGNGTAPPRPYLPPAVRGITVAAAFDVFSGYGTTAEYLALSLARAGARVTAVPLALHPPGLTDELLAMVEAAPDRGDDQPAIYHSWLRADIEPFLDGRDLFISTMWEADRLPPAWLAALQKARAVIVPSAFVARACRASGVTRPVEVVPLGIDPDVYHWQPRPPRDGLCTLIVAPVDDRKHTRLAIEAWKAAFASDPFARLVIKTTYGYQNYVPDDPRVTYVDRIEGSRGITGWYRDADVLLALGNEGFGLPLVEGMATGLPVIALDAEGQADVCREAGGLVLPVPAAGTVPHEHPAGAAGRRSAPDFDTVVRHLRWVDRHRDEAHEMGREASRWVSAHRNAWSVGPAVLDLVQRRVTRPRGPVVPHTLWVPTAGRTCGVAEYAQRLRLSLPGLRLTAAEPEPGVGGIVHVQHEPSIVDDDRLTRYAAQARERGRAVLVTQHSVFDRPAAWERQVRALVAATSAGAVRLRARNAGVPVFQIPLGCETWSFPRKAPRGRTVGFFGFPGIHKGLSRLADAVARVPGCEVLGLAHEPPGMSWAEPVWPSHVPVRWERGWLPLPEVAARLAAEADVLAFHYDEVEHRSSSSAVLLGLSTGVPVLTSDASWFDDLGPAVHRAPLGPPSLAEELERLLDDDDLRASTAGAARAHCEAHSWGRTAARHVDLWNSLRTI
jgi:glycosyltransferase involved in cell wall biosynthesis